MQKNSRENYEKLYKAVLSLKDEKECADFFEDLFTFQELTSIAQRLEIASQISKGKSYNEVNQQTGASTATICRVKKCLDDETSGYQLVFNNLLPQEDQNR